MLAAFRRPAGRLSPIRSRLSRSSRPPFFDFALHTKTTRELALLPVTAHRSAGIIIITLPPSFASNHE